MMQLFVATEMAAETTAPRVEKLVTLLYHKLDTFIRY